MKDERGREKGEGKTQEKRGMNEDINEAGEWRCKGKEEKGREKKGVKRKWASEKGRERKRGEEKGSKGESK